MREVENKNIIKCKCGNNVHIKSYTRIPLILLFIDIFIAIIVRFICKQLIMSGTFAGVYKLTTLIAYARLLVIPLIIATVIVYFISGGSGKCKKCLTQYKFNKYEYKNKRFIKKEN
ncbi:MAG: hypothetical protein ACRCX8_05940 [Sarcina sp.]